MKKVLLMAAVAVMVIAMASGAYAAGSSQQTAGIDVQAVVVAKCDWGVVDGSINFGTFDTGDGSTSIATIVKPKYWCTTGYSGYTIASDFGLNALAGVYRLKHDTSSDYIEYTLTIPAAVAGAGKNNPLDLGITASIIAGSDNDAPAGNYSDTVKLTINY